MRKIDSEKLVWSAQDVANEFEVPLSTVYRRLKATGLQPDGNGTLAVHNALSGDKLTNLNNAQKRERTALLKSQREEQEMRTAQMKGELVDAQDMLQALQSVFIAIRQIIQSSSLPRGDKELIWDNLADIEVVWNQGKKKSQSRVNYHPAKEQDEETEE